MALPWQNNNQNQRPIEKFETQSDSILCIVLGAETSYAALVHYSTESITIISYSTSKKFNNKASLLAAVDACLQELGPESESINDAIFCLSEHWADANDILVEKRIWMKSLLNELSLEGKGFISLTDALLPSWFKMSEISQSLVLLSNPTTVSLNLSSKTEKWHQVKSGRSGDILADLTELIALSKQSSSLQVGNVRNFFITSVDDSESELEQLYQQLLNFNWLDLTGNESPPMVQLVSAKELVSLLATKATDVYRQKKFGSTAMLTNKNSQSDLNIEGSENHQDSLAVFSEEVFGNEVGRQVLTSTHLEKENMVEDQVGLDKDSAENLNDDLVSIEKSDIEEAVGESSDNKQVEKVKPRLRRPVKHRLIIVAVIVAIISGILISLLILMIYIKKIAVVELVLYPVSQVVSQEFSAELSTGNVININGHNLNLEVHDSEVVVSGSSVTTGEKEVGEPAVGKVRILNKSELAKKFDKGTKLTADNSLQFTLNDDLTVPAATVSASQEGTSETKEYGMAEAGVTATKIGPEGNIKTGITLKIAEYSDSTYVAEALVDFTGGSSEKVSIVTDKDVSNLLKDLEKQARSEVVEQNEALFKKGVRVASPHQTKIVTQKVNPAIGEQSEQLQVEITFLFSSYGLKIEDTQALAKDLLSSAVPANFVLSDEVPQILTSFSEASQSGKFPILELSLESQATANVDIGEVKRVILGRPVRALIESAVAIPGVKRAEVYWRPAVAGRLINDIPKDSNKLEIHAKK